MASKKQRRAGGKALARPHHPEPQEENTVRENTQSTQPTQRNPWNPEGVMVTGEAVGRAVPESAEFLIQITTSASTAAQALHENQSRTAHVATALTAQGLHNSDLQTVSMDVVNLYSPLPQAIPAYGPMAQMLGVPQGAGIG